MVWDYNKELEEKVTIRKLGVNLLQIKISNVALGDSGTLKCKAENEYKVPQFKEINLWVLAGKSGNNNSPPSFGNVYPESVTCLSLLSTNGQITVQNV
jgi:hypothetical protein